MNLKSPLELDIYWKNGETCQLEELGIEVDYKPETKLLTFYSVDYVSRGNIGGLDYEVWFLSSGGEEFATMFSYEKLKAEIAKCM